MRELTFDEAIDVIAASVPVSDIVEMLELTELEVLNTFREDFIKHRWKFYEYEEAFLLEMFGDEDDESSAIE